MERNMLTKQLHVPKRAGEREREQKIDEWLYNFHEGCQLGDGHSGIELQVAISTTVKGGNSLDSGDHPDTHGT